MRALILVAGAALAVGACGKNNQNENNQIAGESLTAQNIVSNDVTAIDAVTGDAANMAADVDMNFGNLDNEAVELNDVSTKAVPRKTGPKSVATPTEPAANTATNAD
jgi:hypothetical protein